MGRGCRTGRQPGQPPVAAADAACAVVAGAQQGSRATAAANAAAGRASPVASAAAAAAAGLAAAGSQAESAAPGPGGAHFGDAATQPAAVGAAITTSLARYSHSCLLLSRSSSAPERPSEALNTAEWTLAWTETDPQDCC